MSFGAALGGAAQGASQGLGRFSNALMQVMGSQQRRQQMGQQAEYHAGERAYREQRDMVTDEAAKEARVLQAKTAEARAKEAQRNFDLNAASRGFMPAGPQAGPGAAMDSRVAPPVGLGPSGMGGPRTADSMASPEPQGVGSAISNQFMFGDKAYSRAPAQPFDLDTDPQYQRSVGLARERESLMRGRPGKQQSGMTDGQKEQIRTGLLSRLQQEDGSIDWLGLEDALDDIRKLPGATDEHVEFARNLFKREF